jgi:hypothetical protein
MRNVVLQKLKKKENGDVMLLAERYYTILSAVNNLKLTQREIQLIGFTAVKGNISYGSIREEFCKKHNTSNASINNIISRLKRMGVLVKDASKVKVNPKILLNFENDVVLEIRLSHG